MADPSVIPAPAWLRELADELFKFGLSGPVRVIDGEYYGVVTLKNVLAFGAAVAARSAQEHEQRETKIRQVIAQVISVLTSLCSDRTVDPEASLHIEAVRNDLLGVLAGGSGDTPAPPERP